MLFYKHKTYVSAKPTVFLISVKPTLFLEDYDTNRHERRS
ncbi:hypothetical protein VPHD249_0035 [Vibrio phage D249]